MWFPVRSYGLEKKRMKNELKSTQTAYAPINCTSCPTPAERTLTAAQRARPDPIDLDLARLRARKAILEPDTYYAELEQILRQLTPITTSPPLLPMALLLISVACSNETDPDDNEAGNPATVVPK